MRKLFTLVSFLCMGLVSAFAADPPATKDGYDLVWSDQFNGTSLDLTRWNIETNGDGGGNGELQYYCDKGVSVRDGNLVLTATRESYNGKSFTSGRINSLGKVFFKYGKAEALVKLPNTYKGLWPAFWLMGNDFSNAGWPACGELDIVEMGHSNGFDSQEKANKFLNGALHWGPSNDGHQQEAQDKVLTHSVQDGGYHLFSCEWTEDIIQCSVDGEVYFTKANTGGLANYFKKPFFIIFNLAVGGMFPGISNPVDITAVGPNQGDKAEMLVDYVAIYQKSDAKNLVDVTTLADAAGEIKVDDPRKPVFNADRYYVINIDEATYNGALSNKEVVDLRVNGTSRNLYTWEDTFVAYTPADNTNANGSEGGIISEKGNNYAHWTGLGINIGAAAPADLTGINDQYYLHFDIRTTSSANIELTATASGAYKIRLGGGGDADFARDGQWHSIDIPVSYLMSKGLFFDTSAMTGNIIALSIGDSNDAIDLGGIYYYGPSAANGCYITGNSDVYVGELSELKMFNASGVEVSAIWEVKDPQIGIMSGNTFLAQNPGSTVVTASYNGSTVEKLISVIVTPGPIVIDAEDARDFSADTYYVVTLDETTLGSLSGKTIYNLSPNLYPWDGTIQVTPGSGANAYGVNGNYNVFLSTPKGWSGAGYALSGKDVTGITYEYTLHIDVKSTSTNDITFTVWAPTGDYAFTLGNNSGINFTRDGEWHSIEVPMSYFYAKGLNYAKGSNFSDNIVSVSVGATANVEFGISGVYFYSPKNLGPDEDAPVINCSEPKTTDNSISFTITAVDRTSPLTITVKENNAVIKTFEGVRSGVAQNVLIENVAAGTSHTYTITATDGSENANTSSTTVNATTAELDNVAPVVVIGTPSVTTSSVTFDVTVTDDSAPITIWVKQGEETLKTYNNVASGAKTTVTIDGLTHTTAYTFSVTAQDNAGAKNVSEAQTVNATTATPVAVTGVSFAKTEEAAVIGTKLTLTATVAPADAANKALTWTSSDEAVATVANGVVTPLAEGEATITVKTVDGEFTATCKVTVTAPVIPEIEPQVLTNGDKSVTIYPLDNGDGTYTLIIKSESVMSGLGGSFWHVSGVGADMREHMEIKDGGKTLVITVTSSTKPQPYTPLYVLMPGEVSFSDVTINWQQGKLPENMDPVTPGGDDDPISEIPGSAAPVPTRASESVISLYSDSYDEPSTVGYLEGWGQATTIDQTGNVDGNNYLKYSNFNYIGWSINSAIDASKMTHLHLDICPKAAGSLNVYPIYGGDGKTTDDSKSYRVTGLVAGKWNSINIALTEFAGLDFSSIFQMKFAEPDGFNEFCLDNVYFYKAAPVVASVYNKVVPTTASDDPKVTAPNEHKKDLAFTWTTEENGNVTITVSPIAGATSANFRGTGMNGTFTLNDSEEEFNLYFDRAKTSEDTYTLSLKGAAPAEGASIKFNGQIECATTDSPNDWSNFSFSGFKYGMVAIDNAPVESVSLDKVTVSGKPGYVLNLTATIAPASAGNQNVSWSSSNESVATVADGVVTIKEDASIGATATITVTTEDGGKTATCVVTVVDAIPSAYNNVVPTTTSEDPKVTVNHEHNKDLAFTWSTEENGNVTITVSPVGDATEASFRGTKGMNGTFTLDGNAADFNNYFDIVKTSDNTVTLTLKNAANKPAEGAVIAYNGQIECATTGSNNDWSDFSFAGFAYGSVASEPEAVAVESVTLDKTAADVKPGKTLKLTASVTPANATNKNVTWSSSDENVAIVENGVVTVKAGATVGATVTITVTTEDGSKTATCVVTVADGSVPEPTWHDKTSGVHTNGGVDYTYNIEYVITHNDDKTITIEVLSLEGTLFTEKNPGKQFNFKGEWPNIVDNKATSVATFEAGAKPEMFFWFPYTGGVARVDVPYTVGATKVLDVTAPTDFTASVAAVADNYVALEMKATDEASEKINYTISYSGNTVNVSGNNNEVVKYNVEGLNPETAYTFTISAADAAGNKAADDVVVNATTKSARGEGKTLPAMSGALYTVHAEIINLDGVVTISNIAVTKNTADAKDAGLNISIDNGIVGVVGGSYTISKNAYIPGDKVNGFYYLTYEGGAERIDFSYTVPANAGWDKTAPVFVSVGVKEGSSTPSSVMLEAKATDENGAQVKYLVFQGENHIATLVGNSGETVSQRVGGLVENTTYNFSVYAEDLVGNRSAEAKQVTATTSSYHLVWSDEFDSNTLGTNWNVEVNGDGGGNWEQQYYTDRPENVKIEDGNLVLTAIREEFSMPGDAEPHNYTSGRVTTQNNVTFEHGKIEARIKMPKTKKGLWPAFWMMGNDISEVGWPKCGEIDIVEAGHQNGYGGNEETYFSGCIHWGEAWDTHGYWSGDVYNPYSIMDGEYHVFTCVWEDEWLKMYLDDQKEPYYTAAISKTIDPNIVSADYLHKPNFILFNLAVGGQFPGVYDVEDITALPEPGASASMMVDYVRVYQGGNNVTLANGAENDAAKVTDSTAPTLNLEAQGAAIVATATDNSNNTISYTVHNGTKAVAFGAAKAGESATIEIKGLTVGETYTLTVVASDVFGNTAEKDIVITVPGNVDPTVDAPGTEIKDINVVASLYPADDNATVNTYNAAWWNEPTLDDANGYLKYSGNMGGVIGWEYTAIDASEANFMHIDIWPSATGKITVEPIASKGENNAISAAIPLDVIGGQWNSIDISLADFQAVNENFTFKDLNQLKFSGYGAQTQFCIDNVFFFSAAALNYGPVSIAPEGTATIDGNSMETIDIPEDIEVSSVVMINRSFTPNAISTIMLPFSIEASKVTNAKFYALSQVTREDSKWLLHAEATATLEANTPYLIMTTDSEIGVVLEENETVTLKKTVANVPTTSDVATGTWAFVPTTTYKQWNEGDADLGKVYGFAAKAVDNFSVGQFVKVKAGAYIKPLRAYLKRVEEPSKSLTRAGFGVEELPETLSVVLHEENITGIGTLNTETGEFTFEGWYDLYGNPVEKGSEKSGIIIKNNRKVLVK